MNQISTLLLLFLCISTAQYAERHANSCNDDTKTSSDSQISRNIDTLLPQLVSGTIQNGFIATSYGGGKDRIYGLAQCRGDVSKAECWSCIQDAAKTIRERCPNQSDAIIWYDYCFLRYTSENFFGEVDTFGWYLCNWQDADDPKLFNKKLASLMDQVSSQAVKPVNKGLGKGKSDVSLCIRLYALVQCTRDLSVINCAQCLSTAIRNIGIACANKRGSTIVLKSCYVRYDLYPFYFPLDSQESLEIIAVRSTNL